VGDECYIRGPFGAPMTTALAASHVILVAAGIGVTPIASILQTLLDHHAGLEEPPEEGEEGEGGGDGADAEAGSGNAVAPTSSASVGAAAVGAASPRGIGGRRNESAAKRMTASTLQRLDVVWVNRDADAFSWFQEARAR